MGDGNGASENVRNFVKNNIGKLIKKLSDADYPDYPYVIQFENIPEYLQGSFSFHEDDSRSFTREEIIDFSSNKEELEYIIQAKNIIYEIFKDI